LTILLQVLVEACILELSQYNMCTGSLQTLHKQV